MITLNMVKKLEGFEEFKRITLEEFVKLTKETLDDWGWSIEEYIDYTIPAYQSWWIDEQLCNEFGIVLDEEDARSLLWFCFEGFPEAEEEIRTRNDEAINLIKKLYQYK